jgi:hypothetical protein
MGFNISFDIFDYKKQGILPPLQEYLDGGDEIINYNYREAGEFDKCIWQREPTPQVITRDYMEREANRVLRTGVWICIKDAVMWIPPNYYQFLQYGTASGAVPQFRIKRLKHVYFKIRVRNNPRALGTYTIKNRQDGETTMGMSDCLWQVSDGNMDYGQIGMQSKTRDTVANSCWRTLLMQWNVMPRWLREMLYWDMVSGDKLAEKMRFMHTMRDGDMGRDILMLYGPSVFNAFDSLNNMRICVLDEINKWVECSFMSTFLNYKKFIAPGTSRKGVFDIFSSPSDTNGKHNDEAYEMWKNSDPNELEDGTTKSGIFRYYSNPLEGIEGFYDKFGDADPNQIYDWIMKERKKLPKDKEMAEIRAYPLNEEEMFGATEGVSIWDNHEGIQSRKIYLLGTRFKDQKKKEPAVVYGNLERIDGYIDGDVAFRNSGLDHFDLEKARFCFSFLPKAEEKEPLQNIFRPPRYVQNVVGIDPMSLRYQAKKVIKSSNGAAINYKFRDLFNTGINKCPTMMYNCRPHHQNIFFEDMIKAAIFNRGYVQYENRSDKLANYFEDRGYFDWLLPEIGAEKDSNRKGDSPTSSGAFLNEGMGLINAFTNVPLDEEDPYLLDNVWFLDLLEDISKFNPQDTHKNDLTMAFIQALVGAIKIMNKKVRKPSDLNAGVMTYLLG